MPPFSKRLLRPQPPTVLLTLLALGTGLSSAWGQAPPPLHRAGRVTLGDAVIESGATPGSAVVRLRAPSRIDWQPLDLRAGESLRIRSEAGSLASLHAVRGGLPARLDGSVIADGPFYLISPGGISQAATGSVRAPHVFMSALAAADESAVLRGAATTFSRAGAGLVDLHGTIDATTGGLITVLGTTLSVNSTASLRAPAGQVQLVAADSAVVSVAAATGAATLPIDPRDPNSRANITTRGHVNARRISLISEGFIRNGGRLETGGTGNRVLLSAVATTHEARPRNESIIITDDLVTEGDFRHEGPVISPREGANPAPVGGQRQTPRLSQPGFITQSNGAPTQLGFSPLQTLTTTSPIPPPQRAALVAARRGPDPAATKKRQVTTTTAPATVRKASFFGQSVKK